MQETSKRPPASSPRCAGHKPRATVSPGAALPQASGALQERRVSSCTSVPTTKLGLKVLLSSSGVLGWIIVPSNSPYNVLCVVTQLSFQPPPAPLSS